MISAHRVIRTRTLRNAPNTRPNPTGNTCTCGKLYTVSEHSLRRPTHPLVTAKSVPTRGSHPNARSAASAGICKQRAVSGRISNAWASDATRDCLKQEGARTSNQPRTQREQNDDEPPDAVAYAQRVPSLLSEQEARKFRSCKVVHDSEADGGDEEYVYMVRKAE